MRTRLTQAPCRHVARWTPSPQRQQGPDDPGAGVAFTASAQRTVRARVQHLSTSQGGISSSLALRAWWVPAPQPATTWGLRTMQLIFSSTRRSAWNIASSRYVPRMAPPEPVKWALAPTARARSTISI